MDVRSTAFGVTPAMHANQLSSWRTARRPSAIPCHPIRIADISAVRGRHLRAFCHGNGVCIALRRESESFHMTYDEAMQWLDDHGGAWSVRATRWACAVTATLGSRRIVIDSVQLTTMRVDEALVDAISRIRRLYGNGSTSSLTGQEQE
jgi:hypothetical protein